MKHRLEKNIISNNTVCIGWNVKKNKIREVSCNNVLNNFYLRKSNWAEHSKTNEWKTYDDFLNESCVFVFHKRDAKFNSAEI